MTHQPSDDDLRDDSGQSQESDRQRDSSGEDEQQQQADPPRPTIPSGMFFLPQYGSPTAAQPGYPYGGVAGQASDPPPGKYLARMFSLPGRGLPSMPMQGIGAAGISTAGSTGSSGYQPLPVVPPPAGAAPGIGPAGAILQGSVPVAGRSAAPADARAARSPVGRAPVWQYRVPFPQQDLPTTGVVPN